jgi:hypothetical protein
VPATGWLRNDAGPTVGGFQQIRIAKRQPRSSHRTRRNSHFLVANDRQYERVLKQLRPCILNVTGAKCEESLYTRSAMSSVSRRPAHRHTALADMTAVGLQRLFEIPTQPFQGTANSHRASISMAMGPRPGSRPSWVVDYCSLHLHYETSTAQRGSTEAPKPAPRSGARYMCSDEHRATSRHGYSGARRLRSSS